MPDKYIFVLKIVWKKSIALLHRLTQAVQRANLRRTAGDPTWVVISNYYIDLFGIYAVFLELVSNSKYSSNLWKCNNREIFFINLSIITSESNLES